MIEIFDGYGNSELIKINLQKILNDVIFVIQSFHDTIFSNLDQSGYVMFGKNERSLV